MATPTIIRPIRSDDAPFAIGDRVIRRERPDFGSTVVIGFGTFPSGTQYLIAERATAPGLSPIRTEGLLSGFIRVWSDWQEPPVSRQSATSEYWASRVHRDITDEGIADARATDAAQDVADERVAEADAYLEWIRNEVYPLDQAFYGPYLLAAMTHKEMAIRHAVEVMAGQSQDFAEAAE